MSTSPDYRPTLAGILDGVYACTRVWEGWQVGTMSEEDFVPAVETEIRSDLQTWRDRATADEDRHMADYFDKWAEDPQWNSDERNMLLTVVTALRARGSRLDGQS